MGVKIGFWVMTATISLSIQRFLPMNYMLCMSLEKNNIKKTEELFKAFPFCF